MTDQTNCTPPSFFGRLWRLDSTPLLKVTSLATLLVWSTLGLHQAYFFFRYFLHPPKYYSRLALLPTEFSIFFALAALGCTFAYLALRRARYSDVIASTLLCAFAVCALSSTAQMIRYARLADLLNISFSGRLVIGRYLLFCGLLPFWLLLCIRRWPSANKVA